MIEKYVDKEELRRLLSTLAVILGCLIIAALFASIVLPGIRNANRPPTPTAVAPVIGESGWLDPAEFPPQKGSVVPPVDSRDLMTASPELINRGKKLFEDNCTACHGVQGQGDGPAASTMNPRPRNFTSPDGWKNGYHAPGIYKTLTEGISGTSMSSFDYLSKKNRMAVVQYVQTLGKFPYNTASSQAMESLSQLLASAGERTPNRIPVSMAMNRLTEEFAAAPPIQIEKEDQSPGANLVRRIVLDPTRAAQFLAQARMWRTSYRELAGCVVREMPVNGFSTRSAALNAAEWQMLHSELLKRVKTK